VVPSRCRGTRANNQNWRATSGTRPLPHHGAGEGGAWEPAACFGLPGLVGLTLAPIQSHVGLGITPSWRGGWGLGET